MKSGKRTEIAAKSSSETNIKYLARDDRVRPRWRWESLFTILEEAMTIETAAETLDIREIPAFRWSKSFNSSA